MPFEHFQITWKTVHMCSKYTVVFQKHFLDLVDVFIGSMVTEGDVASLALLSGMYQLRGRDRVMFRVPSGMVAVLGKGYE